MTNPYTPPSTPRNPRWARKRYILPALALALFVGVGIGAADEDPASDTEPAAAQPRPTVTVTATATATHTADPEPAPTVTETRTVKVTTTVTAQPAYGGGTSGGEAADAGGSGSVHYANCTAARAAGDTPLYAGDPGYDSHLDRDGDGVACE
ncbi:excalibur calcium-binding domain-containing protein [Streptomyces eurythermus]